MKPDKPKRYFDVEEKPKNKRIRNQEVEVYNIEITPGLLKRQRRNANTIRKRPTVYKKDIVKKFPGKAPLDPKKLQMHSRGDGFYGIGVKHPLLLQKLKQKEDKINYAQEQAARAEILLTEEQG